MDVSVLSVFSVLSVQWWVSQSFLSPLISPLFVNGTQVLKDGEHTAAKPGRVVRGPGWTWS
jgi:hypothetical protein